MASAAIASLLSMSLLSTAQAQDATKETSKQTGKEKEKCYGIAQAGTNDCANLSGSHSCAGQAKVSNGIDEWNYVAKGSCAKMGGKSFDEAKATLDKASDRAVEKTG